MPCAAYSAAPCPPPLLMSAHQYLNTSPAHTLYSPPCRRDRAKERRDGLNIDFADAEQELAARGLGPTALKSLTIGALFVWVLVCQRM